MASAPISTKARAREDGRRKDELVEGIDAALEPYRGSRAVLSFDSRAAEKYADVLVARERAGSPIFTADAQIAAISLSHHATCATRNVKDFVHTGVELLDPWSLTGNG